MLSTIVTYVVRQAPAFCYIAGSLLFIVGTVIGMLRA